MTDISQMSLSPHELGLPILADVTPEELREEIRKRVDSQWPSRAAFARKVRLNYPNFNEYLNASARPKAKKKGRTISADTLLKIAPVIGLTISFEELGAVRENAQETVAERPMHPAGPPEGRPYAGAVSPEALTAAIASAVASSVDSLGERIERALERVAGGQSARPAPAPRVPARRKHGR